MTQKAKVDPHMHVCLVKLSPCHHHITISISFNCCTFIIGVILSWQISNLAHTSAAPLSLLQDLTRQDALNCPSSYHHYYWAVCLLVAQLFVWITLIWPLSCQQAFSTLSGLQLTRWVLACLSYPRYYCAEKLEMQEQLEKETFLKGIFLCF